MRIVIGLPQLGSFADVDTLRRVATAAQASGLSSLWAIDRLLVPVNPKRLPGQRRRDPATRTTSWPQIADDVAHTRDLGAHELIIDLQAQATRPDELVDTTLELHHRHRPPPSSPDNTRHDSARVALFTRHRVAADVDPQLPGAPPWRPILARHWQHGAETRRGTPQSASDLDFLGSPYGIRTRAATLRGWCPRPLDERAVLPAPGACGATLPARRVDELGREESNP